LARLAEAVGPSVSAEITLIGGAAMTLGFGSRRTTQDVDVILNPDTRDAILDAAERIRHEFGLPADWLNERAMEAGLLVMAAFDALESHRSVVLELGSLRFSVPSMTHLAAMKLPAVRGDSDIDDLLLLLDRLKKNGLEDVEMAWATLGGMVPLAEQGKARYNLEKVWVLLNEST